MTKTAAEAKIRKLRALSAGASTEKEAAAAASAAFRLKAKHGITENDLHTLVARRVAVAPERSRHRGLGRRGRVHTASHGLNLTTLEQRALLKLAERGLGEMERAWGISGLARMLLPILRGGYAH